MSNFKNIHGRRHYCKTYKPVTKILLLTFICKGRKGAIASRCGKSGSTKI